MGGRLRGRGVWSGDSSEEIDSWGEVWVLVFLTILCFSVMNQKQKNLNKVTMMYFTPAVYKYNHWNRVIIRRREINFKTTNTKKLSRVKILNTYQRLVCVLDERMDLWDHVDFHQWCGADSVQVQHTLLESNHPSTLFPVRYCKKTVQEQGGRQQLSCDLVAASQQDPRCWLDVSLPKADGNQWEMRPLLTEWTNNRTCY